MARPLKNAPVKLCAKCGKPHKNEKFCSNGCRKSYYAETRLAQKQHYRATQGKELQAHYGDEVDLFEIGIGIGDLA